MKKFIKSNWLVFGSIIVFGFVLLAFSPDPQDIWEVPEEYKSMKNPAKVNKESIAIGKSLYNTHCKSCHGSTGKGDGRIASSLETPMRSLAAPEYKSQKDGEKYFKSFIGRDEMPNFEKKITDEEDRWFIINYVEEFQ